MSLIEMSFEKFDVSRTLLYLVMVSLSYDAIVDFKASYDGSQVKFDITSLVLLNAVGSTGEHVFSAYLVGSLRHQNFHQF